MEDITSVPRHLLWCPETEFERIIHLQNVEEVSNSISFLQRQIMKEQNEIKKLQDLSETHDDNVNKNDLDTNSSLKNQLNTLNSSVANLIQRSMKCFDEYKIKIEQVKSGTVNAKNIRDSMDFSHLNHIKNSSLYTNTKEQTGKNLVVNKEPEHPTQNQNCYKDINKQETTESDLKTEPQSLKEMPAKVKGLMVIQEFSSRTAIDDIRRDIEKTVDRSAKENVSKFLLKNVRNNPFLKADTNVRKSVIHEKTATETANKTSNVNTKSELPERINFKTNDLASKMNNGSADVSVHSSCNLSSSIPSIDSKHFEENNQKNEAKPENRSEKSCSVINTDADSGTENRMNKSVMKSRAAMLSNFLQTRYNNSKIEKNPHKRQVNAEAEVSEGNIGTNEKTEKKYSITIDNDNKKTSYRDIEKVNQSLASKTACQSNGITLEANISKDEIKQTHFVKENHDITDETSKETQNIQGAQTKHIDTQGSEILDDVTKVTENIQGSSISDVTKVTENIQGASSISDVTKVTENIQGDSSISDVTKVTENIQGASSISDVTKVTESIQGSSSISDDVTKVTENIQGASSVSDVTKVTENIQGSSISDDVTKVTENIQGSSISDDVTKVTENIQGASVSVDVKDNTTAENIKDTEDSMTNENSAEWYKPSREISPLVSPFNTTLPKQDEELFTEDKQSLNHWDPSTLFMDLYNIQLVPDDTQDLSQNFIEMEGVMEKLPMNKKKSTLLKTWKRRYFIAKNGWLIYYDNHGDQHPSDEILLMGGTITMMNNLVIGIDDNRGHYLMVRCPSAKEYDQWLTALQSQTVDNIKANYIQPLLDAPKCIQKNILIIEMGSMSLRAGILKENPTLPQIFFPNVVAVNYSEKKHFVGFEAYKPCNRLDSKLIHLFGLSDKIDKFKIEYEILPSIFTAIFQDLKVNPKDYQVMMVLPLPVCDKDKGSIMEILMNRFNVKGVCMVTQAITALYSYNTKSGVMVDIGERMEVIPIYDGFAIETGQSVQTYGAGKVRQSLRLGLAKHNFPMYSPIEQIIIRYVMEQTCYVSKHYAEEIHKYIEHPEKFLSSLYLNKYDVPKDSHSTISHDVSRFAAPEGFFNTDLWGMDYPTVQALVLKAINACPLDSRRYICRSIYLSGGVTMIPGFSVRLEKEVQKLVNPSLVVQVHSSPQRYHAAYIGACILSALPEFEDHCISVEEWKKEGTKAFRKWIY